MLKTFTIDFNQLGVDLPIPLFFNAGDGLTGFHVILCLVLNRLGYQVNLASPLHEVDPIIADLLEHHLVYTFMGIPSNALVNIKALGQTTFFIAFTY